MIRLYDIRELTVGLVRLFKPIRGVFASLTLVFFFKETLSESINADWPFLLLIRMNIPISQAYEISKPFSHHLPYNLLVMPCVYIHKPAGHALIHFAEIGVVPMSAFGQGFQPLDSLLRLLE